MAMSSFKNQMLRGGAAMDLGLGLGDMASEQLSDEEKERRKKLMQQGGPMGFGDPMANASSMLLGKGY